MKPRYRKLAGMALLLPLIGIYFFAAAALGEYVPDVWFLKAAYYMTAGIIWSFPAKYLVVWMHAVPGRSP